MEKYAMKGKKLLVFGLALPFLLAAAGAASLDEVKERMKERLPLIVQLKEARAAGENRQGLLEVVEVARSELEPELVHELVTAENDDRQAVYRALGEQYQIDPREVGRVRARQIYEEASPGVLLKSPEGRWLEKPAAKGENE